MTVFALTTGAASATGQREIDPAHLTWGAGGSDYAEQRRLLTGESGSWLREVSSHDILREIIPAYFTSADGRQLACEDTARAAAALPGIVGRACGAGAVARIAGGTPCTAVDGTIEPGRFT